MIRGLGHRDDLPGFADRPASALVGAGAPMARERDWRFLDETVYDQHDTNTCVAWSCAQAVYLRGLAAELRGEGDPVSFPCVLHGYTWGQLEDQRLDGIPRERRRILDLGMRARALFSAWANHGLVSEARWPYHIPTLRAIVSAPTAAEASKLMPFDLDVAGADAKMSGSYRINDNAKSVEIMRALDRAHFPVMAIRVWTNFGDVRGDEVYTTPRGRHEGNHMMVAVAFRPGAICFRNTWGAGFGDRGHVWISTDFLDGPNGLDAWCVTAAPQLH